MKCDIHPDCQDQGCEANPANCRRARDRRISFADIDDAGKLRKIKYLLTDSSQSVPHSWVAWLISKYVPTPAPRVRKLDMVEAMGFDT
jgi:hypothetical protein